MTIGELKRTVAAYLQKDVEFFTKNSIDLLLVSLNNARRRIEQQHDFNANRVEAQVTVSPTTGGALSSAVLRGTATAVNLKEYITFYRVADGGDVPLYHHPKKNVAVWAKERIWNARGKYNDLEYRYPDDEQMRSIRIGPEEVFVHGGTIFINPTPAVNTTVIIDGVKWGADYTVDADTDYFTQYGHEYLMWSAIVEVNYFAKVFDSVNGNLGPPERAKQAAMERLILQDSMQVEQGRQPRGLR